MTPTVLRRPAVIAALAVALTLGGGACSSGNAKQAGAAPATTATSAASSHTAVAGAVALQDAYESVLGRVRPEVVEISTSVGLGSGIVFDDKGDIVTNAHVVGTAVKFRVSLVDGRTLDGALVGAYPPDDLAVIKVPAAGLVAASFADSAQVKVGEIALAIGNPLGLESSVTDGIVSSTGRTVSEGGGVVLPSTIQTSAAINPGNSGGALVDLNGDVIGIPTLAAVDPQLGGGAAAGIGFAIPSNTVKRITDQLIASGKVSDSGRAALGITGATASTLDGRPIGVLIRSVQAGRAAAAAGITAGDILTSVDGKPTRTLDDLQTVLADLAPGKLVSVDVIHQGGQTQTDKVTLGRL
ncbi:MAG: trypsin-like peptidase domain-containing protein [Actinomycetota bacterium]|nr:trypsin-like peptidase domain-containing protein [Actinomycetota bacterium]